MRSISTALALAVLCTAPQAMAADGQPKHVFFLVGNNDQNIVMLDRQSLTLSNGVISGWSLWVYYPDADEMRSAMYYMETHCAARTSAIIGVKVYDSNDKEIDGGSLDQPQAKVAPGSLGEKLLDKTCKHATDADRVIAFEREKAVSIGRGLMQSLYP